MTADDANVRAVSPAREARERRYAEAIAYRHRDITPLPAALPVDIWLPEARSVIPIADAERAEDATTIAELRAQVERVRALADAFADDELTRHGGNIAWHIEEAIANEKGDFPDAADRRIASQRVRAEAAEGRLRAVEALADLWEQASGLRSGFSSAELEMASQSQRTLWEAADDLRAVLAELPDADGRRERLADCLYRWNGSALYGRDLGPFDGDRMESERGRWLEQADAILAALAPSTSPAEQERCTPDTLLHCKACDFTFTPSEAWAAGTRDVEDCPKCTLDKAVEVVAATSPAEQEGDRG